MKFFLFLLLSNLHFGLLSQTDYSPSDPHIQIILFSGSDWCRPCMKMKRELIDTEEFKTLTGSTEFLIADFPQNNKLISVEQLKKNESLASIYNKGGSFPKMVILDSKGAVLGEKSGYDSTQHSEYLLFITHTLEQ